jgi:capsular polysaccharide transport system permease protein
MRLPTLGIILAKIILQFRVITALARREMDLKSAKGGLGAFGLFLEPVLLIGTFLLLRVLLRAGGQGSYINVVLWMAVGFVPFFVFADIAIKAIGGVEKRSGLMFYRRIRPLDTLMGNAFLLGQVFGLILILFIVGVSIWEWRLAVENIAGIIFVYIGIVMLGFGVGLTTLVIGHRLPVVAKLVKTLLRRLLLWTSCVFFSISMIPDAFRPWILWNPIAHGIELMRIACNPGYPAPGVSMFYFWSWVAVSLGLGLLIYGNNQELLYGDEKSGNELTDLIDG